MPSCRDITSLLVAEPDGTLNALELARIEAHVATCSSCRQQRAILAAAPGALRAATAAITAPDPDREWALLRERIQESDAPRTAAASARTPLRRELSGAGDRANPFGRALTWGLPLAAAAAVAVVAFFRPTPATSPSQVANSSQPAATRADGVAGDGPPSSLVYVDQESGWLIVWSDQSTDRTG